MPEQYTVTYDSIEDIAKVAIPYLSDGSAYGGDLRYKFTGVRTIDHLKSLAVNGWDKEVAEAMDIAETAISTVSQEIDMPSFSATWDVSGGEVDVARYLSGEPECMIDYHPVATPRAGRVITLCASVSYSGAVSKGAIKRRGHAIAALAFAISRMGFAVELWADMSAKDGGYEAHMRVLVKGANDELDPARIMFAYSHPGMLRALGMPAMHAYPPKVRSALGVGYGYGMPLDPKEDLADGTIYLPSVTSDRDIPNADVALMQYLREIGIIV